MLICDNLRYKNRFRNVGFCLTPGALLAVSGRDAVGLLMLLADKLKPSAGTITFEDHPIRRNRDYHELMLYHPPAQKLRSSETVEKAVKCLAKAGGGSPELAEAALRYWGLIAIRALKCGNVSAGMQQRILLTRLLTLSRPVWLLDTPESGLDAEGLAMLDALIANRCNQLGIVVIATGRKNFITPLPVLYMQDFA